MGDRVAVMRKGELLAGGRSAGLYDRPVNLFVAGIHRQPSDEHGRGELGRTNGPWRRKIGSSASLARRDPGRPLRLHDYEGGQVVLGSGPRIWRMRSSPRMFPADRRIKGNVELTEQLGSKIIVHFTVDARPALTEDIKELARTSTRPRSRWKAGSDKTTMDASTPFHLAKGRTAQWPSRPASCASSTRRRIRIYDSTKGA